MCLWTYIDWGQTGWTMHLCHDTKHIGQITDIYIFKNIIQRENKLSGRDRRGKAGAFKEVEKISRFLHPDEGSITNENVSLSVVCEEKEPGYLMQHREDNEPTANVN